MTDIVNRERAEEILKDYIFSLKEDCPELLNFSWFNEMTSDEWVASTLKSRELISQSEMIPESKRSKMTLSEAIELLELFQKFPEVREARNVLLMLSDEARDAENKQERDAVTIEGAFSFYVMHSSGLAHKNGYFFIVGYRYRIASGEFSGPEDIKLHKHLCSLNLVKG